VKDEKTLQGEGLQGERPSTGKQVYLVGVTGNPTKQKQEGGVSAQSKEERKPVSTGRV